MFALNWGIINLVNLQVLGNTGLGVACCAAAVAVAGLMLAYFAKIALKLHKLLKVSNSGQ
jgi:CDP-diglyceride synthetase